MSAAETPTIIDSLRKIAVGVSADINIVPQPARVRDEELVVCYSEGEGRFSSDKQYFSVRAKIYKMDGTLDGSWSGEHQILVPLSSVWQTLPQPVPPFNIPIGPVPDPQPQAYTKAIWKFGDGSSLTVVGQAQLHAAKFQNHETAFWISANQLISNGTGRYCGAQGLKICGLTALVPAGQQLEDVSTPLKIKSIDVFRIALKSVIGQIPQAPGNH
jgi:hypothetical protein